MLLQYTKEHDSFGKNIYRPVSILATVSKVYEKVMLSKNRN